MTTFLGWLFEAAPSERAALEAFYLWIYTGSGPRGRHRRRFIDEALAFPHQQPPESILAQLAAFTAYESYDRLPEIAVPTLVLAGGADIICPPRLGRVVAERIPGADLRGAGPTRPTSRSRRCPTCSTPGSTPSGSRSDPTVESGAAAGSLTQQLPPVAVSG